MMLDKKQIQAVFLFKFKMGHKAAKTSHNTNRRLAEELMNVQCSGGSRRFARETEPWRRGAQWPVIRSWQWLIERIFDADPITVTQEIAKLLNVNLSIVIWHLKQIGKVKSPEWVLKSWLQIKKEKKNHHFEVSVNVSYST